MEEDKFMLIAMAIMYSILPDNRSTTKRRQSMLGQQELLFKVKVSSEH